MVKVSAQVPVSLRSDLEELARLNDRSVSAELRRAIAEHLQTSPLDEVVVVRDSPSRLSATAAGSSTALQQGGHEHNPELGRGGPRPHGSPGKSAARDYRGPGGGERRHRLEHAELPLPNPRSSSDARLPQAT